jgi:hypothetical protein
MLLPSRDADTVKHQMTEMPSEGKWQMHVYVVENLMPHEGK